MGQPVRVRVSPRAPFLSFLVSPFFSGFVPVLVSGGFAGLIGGAIQSALPGDSLGGAKHDKLSAFNFRSFCGDSPKPYF